MRITRREFLKSGGAALASFALYRPALAGDKDRPILIVIFQRGAADGLSMAVSCGDKNYSALRPQIAISDSADLDGFFGLHPALNSLKSIYDEGHLPIVHAVGSPNNTRSHFDAQDYMESGTPGNKSIADGWLNRYMQVSSTAAATPFRGVAFSASVPRCLMGAAPTLVLQRLSDFGIRAGQFSEELEEAFAPLYRDPDGSD